MERMEPGSSARAVVGDNGLNFDVRKFFPLVTVAPVPDPFIHMRALNIMAATCGPDADLIVMGDDATFASPGWLTTAERLLTEWPDDLGAVNFYHTGYMDYGDYVSWLDSHARHEEIFRSIWTLPLLGTLIPASVRQRIGPFDERFTGYGYDDVDYCVSLLHAGFKIGITKRVQISHAGQGTYGDGTRHRIDDEANHNRALFYGKRGLPIAGPGYPETAPHFKFASCGCKI